MVQAVDRVIERRQMERENLLLRREVSKLFPPTLIGDSAKAMRLSQMLRERGLMVTAIRPPTVPAGSARLRVTLSAAHSEAQVQLLLNALAECYPQLENADA